MAAVFDADHFRTMTGGDAALQAEVAGLFREQAAKALDTLRGGGQAETLRIAVHTLKGSARGIGLWALAEACERAEPRVAEETARHEVRAALAEALDALAAPQSV